MYLPQLCQSKFNFTHSSSVHLCAIHAVLQQFFQQLSQVASQVHLHTGFITSLVYTL